MTAYPKFFPKQWEFPQGSRYDNIIFDQELIGEIDIQRLDNAIKRFISDCALLNSHIQYIDGKLCWVKNKNICDLNYSENKLIDKEVLLYAQKPFKIENGPLYRFKLIKNHNNNHRFIIVLSPIIIANRPLKYFVDEISKYFNYEYYKISDFAEGQFLKEPELSSFFSKYNEFNNEKNKLFWKERLADSESLDLSFLSLNGHQNLLSNSQQRPDLQIEELSATGEIRFSFDKKIFSHLSEVVKKFKITPYLYSQSIFALLINKYTGQDRFFVGYSIAVKEDVACLHKHITDTVVTYDFSKISNIIDVINQSMEFFKSLEQKGVNHTDLAVSEIFAVSNKEFPSIAFVAVDIEDAVFDFHNIKCSINNRNSIDLASKLSFVHKEINGEVKYIFKYNSEQISSNLLCDFISEYKRIFIEVLDELSTKNISSELTHINNYSLLSAEQYQKIIYRWNDTDKICFHDKTINELFEEQVEKTPENIAIIYENTNLKYAELNEKANRLANFLLRNYDITPDTLISLCLDRSEHVLIAILAVLKAGGAYVPINPSYPDERISYILKDTKTKLILTNKLYKKRMNDICKFTANSLLNDGVWAQIGIVELDNIEMQERLLLEPRENPDKSMAKIHNLAYVIYTSGTTGKPKGVMIEHRSYVATIECMKNLYFADKQQINTYNIANYAFDMAGPEYGLPLFTGGIIVLGNNEFNFLDCSSYDFIQITPTLCDLKLDCLINVENTKLFIGAETLSQDLLVKVLNRSMDVVHLYGPTETTVWSTSKYYSCKEDVGLLSVVLGKPFDNEKIYVLDGNLSPLPIGAIGELYIGGIGLARGYLNMQELTAERFIPNPFQTNAERVKDKNTRLYKTGDLVRWLPDGNLEYIGRNDFQVKVRGYRIELGEVEASLSNYKGVKQSVVLPKDHLSKGGSPTGSKYLIGYYVSDSKLDEAEILNYLQNRLPEYMVPNILMHLPNLPQTINGKLDRKALPEPKFTNSDNYIAPRDELERNFCNIASEVLGLPENNISIHDDFFRLGGDSILAIRLIAKLNKEFNSKIKVREIYELRSILKLTELVKSEKNNYKEDKPYFPFSLVEKKNHKVIISEIDFVEDIFPASFLQDRMLVESEQDNNGTYHIVSNYSVQAKLDKNKLLSVFKTLVDKHEMLRSGFVLKDSGRHLAFVCSSITIDCQLYKNENSKKLIRNEKVKNFDYSKPGLFRLIVNDLGNNFDLIFSIHNAIEDGWSMATIINEFGQAYINNVPIDSKVTLRYGEFIRNELAAIKNKENIKFWENYLDGMSITSLDLEVNKKKSENNLNNSYFTLEPEQVKSIHNISREAKISVDSIFLLSYFKALSYFTKNSDITIGVTTNNRLEKEGGDKLFGQFINIIPFRFNLNKHQNNFSLLLELFKNKVKLQKHKNLPYDYIKSLFKHELYDFVFDFVHLHILSERVKGIESIDGYERTHIPFILTVAQKGNDLFGLSISTHDEYSNKEFLDDFISYYKECLAETISLVQQEILTNC